MHAEPDGLAEQAAVYLVTLLTDCGAAELDYHTAFRARRP